MDLRDLKDQLAAGGLRETLNRNSALVTVAALVLLMVSLGLVFLRLGGSGGGGAAVTELYFYDLSTGELFVADRDAVPPHDAPSGARVGYPWGEGPAGVRAQVFACGDCSDESAQFVAYVEAYPPRAQQALQEARSSNDPERAWELEAQVEGSTLIGALGPAGEPPARWVSMMSPESEAVLGNLHTRCSDGQRLTPCFPGR